MCIKRFFMTACLIVAISESFAQLRYPVVGHYKDAGMQGMAIYNDMAYLLNAGGRCRVYDLKKQEVVGEFMLGSASEENHVNVACFGCEIPEGGVNPAMYTSQCWWEPYSCFVESISKDTAQLVQTINATENDKVFKVDDWVVDPENQHLYAISRTVAELDTLASVANVITKYRLPKLSEGKEVTLTEKDMLDRFSVIFPNILQGGIIKGRYLYLPTGLGEGDSFRKDAKRSLKVIDLEKKRLAKDIDLTYLTTNEPEDIDFYEGRLLLNCGGQGGLWEIKLK